MVEFTGDYDMISCWEEALDSAVQAQFGRLFDVLLRDPSEQGMKRFGNGIKLLSGNRAGSPEDDEEGRG